MSVELVPQIDTQPLDWSNEIPDTARPEDLLSKPEKAAILLNVLIGADATPDLDNVSTKALKSVIDTMSSFGQVGRQTIDAVIMEFLAELQDFGITMDNDLEKTLASLQGRISDKALSNIRNAYAHSPTISPWSRVSEADASQLQNCLEQEHIGVAAIVLSKIPSALSAAVLGNLEPEMARSIMLAIIKAADASPEVVDTIGHAIIDTLFDEEGPTAFDKPPVERAGAIMNFTQSATRERILEEFGKSDPETAEKIRAVMFTFADIPSRIEARDMPAITREVAPDILLLAIKGAESESPKTAEYILSNLSSRAADQLREELAELEGAKKKDMEAAMNDVVSEIRRLESEAVISFVMSEDEE